MNSPHIQYLDTDHSPVNLKMLARASRRQWKWLLGACALTIAGTVGLYVATPTEYEAKARVIVEQPGQIGGDAGALLGMGSSKLGTQVEVLNTRELVEAVQKQFGYKEPFDEFTKRFRFNQVSRTDVIEVTARGEDAKRSAELANAIVLRYLDFNANLYRNNPNSAGARLDREIKEKERELAQADAALTRFLREKSLAVPEEEFKAGLLQLAELNKREAEIRATERGTFRQVEGLKAQLAEQSPTQIVAESFALPKAAEELGTRLANLRVDRSKMLEEFQPTAPEVAEIEAQIKSAETELAQLVKQHSNNGLQRQRQDQAPNLIRQGIQESLVRAQVELEGSRAVLANIRRQINEHKTNLRRVPGLAGEYATLMRRREAAQRTWAEKLKLSEAMTAHSIVTQVQPQFLQAAVPPEKPSAPKPGLMALLGVLTSVILGASVVLWREAVDKRISDRWSAERMLGAPVLMDTTAGLAPGKAVQLLFYALKSLGGGSEWNRVMIVPLEPSAASIEWRSLIQEKLNALNGAAARATAAAATAESHLPVKPETLGETQPLVIQYSNSLNDGDSLHTLMTAERFVLLVPVGAELTPELQEIIHWLGANLLGVVLFNPNAVSLGATS